MKTLLKILSLFLVLSLVSCSSIAVKSDYDHEIDFAHYKTYGWMVEPEKPVSEPIVGGTLMEERIKNAVNKELTAKGYQEQTDGRPDFFVDYHISIKEKVAMQGRNYHNHNWRGRFWARERIDVYQYREGTLLLDFIVPESEQLVWRGWAVGVVEDFDPEEMEKKINESVRKILQKFPPQ